jgi:hypothetical protein
MKWKQSQATVSHRFAALKIRYNVVDINRFLETIGDNMNISVKASVGHFEQKQRKQWFDKESSKLWQNDAGWSAVVAESKPNDRRSFGHVASRTFRTKKWAIYERQGQWAWKNSRNKNICNLYNGSNPLLYTYIRRAVKGSVVGTEYYHCYRLHTKFYPAFFFQD